jgi:hypothetical protein
LQVVAKYFKIIQAKIIKGELNDTDNKQAFYLKVFGTIIINKGMIPIKPHIETQEYDTPNKKALQQEEHQLAKGDI